MALIGNLRKHSGIIVGTIALSIVGFLIMDATNSQSGVLRGRNPYVGVVDGEKIDYNDFMKKYEDNQKAAEDQMRSRGGSLTDDQRNAVRQQTWDDYVNITLMQNTYNKAGVTVTDDEMVELTTGQNVHPYIRQSFTNPQTGQFDPQMIKFFLQNIDIDDKGVEPGTKRKQWNALEAEIKKSELMQKYATLVAKGLTAPTWLAQEMYQDYNRTADVKFVALPYSDINEADIKYTDDDLKNYLKEHQAAFKQKEETRKILYAEFPIIASASDSAAELSELNTRLEEFKKGKTSTEDSLFVRMYSETPFDYTYFRKSDLANSPKADEFFSAPVKTVIGPYEEGGLFVYSKIVNRKLLSDSVRVRDIVFSFDNIRTQEEGNAKRRLFDSVWTAIDSFHKDFSSFVAFSDDAASKAKGGDMGWIKFGQVEKPFNDVLFYFGTKGKPMQTMTQNALHIVQIVDDKPTTPAVQLAHYTKAIVPSAETEKIIYAEATRFVTDNSTAAKFEETAKKSTNIKAIETVRKQDYSLLGINNARELVRWIFGAKKDDVSPIISADQKHVVALLDEIRPAGEPEFGSAKEQVKFAFIKDKKAELLKQKVEAAQATSLDLLASKLNKQVLEALQISVNNPMLGAAGYEPAIALAAEFAPQNKVTAPLQGNSGIFVLQKTGGTEPPKATDLTMYKMQSRQRAQAKAMRGISEALQELAVIKDNRFDFF